MRRDLVRLLEALHRAKFHIGMRGSPVNDSIRFWIGADEYRPLASKAFKPNQLPEVADWFYQSVVEAHGEQGRASLERFL